MRGAAIRLLQNTFEYLVCEIIGQIIRIVVVVVDFYYDGLEIGFREMEYLMIGCTYSRLDKS